MLKTGDYVLRKTGGIWGVIDILPDEYLLKEIQRETIEKISTDSEDLIREIITEDNLMDVIERIPYICTLQAPNDKLRKELYDEAMAKYDEIEWIKVIKTIYMRKREKRLMPYEMKYDIEAKKYFHGEIAAILGIEFDEVEKYIKAYIAKIW